MGNRLSRIVTRTGDEGTTGLADGSRVAKTAARVEALGTVDELNSHLGLLLAAALPAEAAHSLLRIQHDLFDLGGELSLPGQVLIDERHLNALEADVERFNAPLPPLKEFVLPGGGVAAANCHVARTVARRAERRVWSLAAAETVNPVTVAYLNRLSDLLFVLARVLARADQGELLWNRKRFEEPTA
ncbi:cob(I)yrinic acid a,c-diamide adenosyltransferase [bacterium]|nr:MAG: cob(I)yrinic acid a,c-diamide adenosyltransferase [bacterium]